VPQRITGFFVAGDGTVLTNTGWDEGCGEVSRFDRDGRLTGIGWHTHGWGYGGGTAVTANEKYVFIAQRIDSEGGGLLNPMTWPAKGKFWHGVSRRMRTDIEKGVPFDGGKGEIKAADGRSGDVLVHSLLVVSEAEDKRINFADRDDDTAPGGITALAATANRLFVADSARGSIRVYDAESMTPVTEWADLTDISAVTLDSAGRFS
jgi:hypothetical protein